MPICRGAEVNLRGADLSQANLKLIALTETFVSDTGKLMPTSQYKISLMLQLYNNADVAGAALSEVLI